MYLVHTYADFAVFCLFGVHGVVRTYADFAVFFVFEVYDVSLMMCTALVVFL